MTANLVQPDAPKRRTGRNILIGCGVLIVVCVVLGGIAFAVAGPAITGVFNALAAPISAGNDFMNALIAKDYNKAYGMIHSSQQAAFGGSADGMKQMMEAKVLEPTVVTFTNVQIIGDAIWNGTGTFGGNMKYIYLSLRKDGDAWKIIGIQVNDNAPTATPTGG